MKLKRRRFLSALAALPAALFGAKKTKTAGIFSADGYTGPQSGIAIVRQCRALEDAEAYQAILNRQMSEIAELAVRCPYPPWAVGLVNPSIFPWSPERFVRIVAIDGQTRTVKINEGL